MKNKKNPSEFLGAKVLSTFDDSRIKGGKKKSSRDYTPCGPNQQYQGQQQCQQQIPTQQQQIQNAF